MFVIDFIYSQEISTAVSLHFSTRKKKATCYQLKSKKATKHPSRQQSFFLTNQEVDQR